MAQPKFRRFWVIIEPNGTPRPQFDPKTGKSIETTTYKGPIAQVLFYAVTPLLAQRISSAGDMAEPSSLPPLKFDIPPGEECQFYRQGKLRLDFRKVCGFCEYTFPWEVEECPRCLATTQFYCSHCEELKRDPIVELKLAVLGPDGKPVRRHNVRLPLLLWGKLSDGDLRRFLHNIPPPPEQDYWTLLEVQIRCPDCERKHGPHGLIETPCIGKMTTESHYTNYVLQIGSQKHIILDYKLTRSPKE